MEKNMKLYPVALSGFILIVGIVFARWAAEVISSIGSVIKELAVELTIFTKVVFFSHYIFLAIGLILAVMALRIHREDKLWTRIAFLVAIPVIFLLLQHFITISYFLPITKLAHLVH